MQGQDWTNEVGGLNCYLRALENHNPNLPFTADEHRWIPQGLPYDLIDPGGETIPVIDNVDAYNTQLVFGALQDDVRDIPAFRIRLLQQNGNLQLANVNDLFFRYGY